MRFTVIWHPEALKELGEIWLSATDRERVSLAANSIDRILANNPQLCGEEFYGDRKIDVEQLSVIFNYSEEDRLVRVLNLWT